MASSGDAQPGAGSPAGTTSVQSDQPVQVAQQPAANQESQLAMDSMASNRNKINALHDQIQELHTMNDFLAQSSIQAQINEPEFKKIRIVLDDHKTHLLELQARMQDQEHAHTRQMASLLSLW